ncbi:MAG TPA: TorF family putative porin [Telluria sp.]|nr:TorF family putative porin [Telluria sp.]
MPVQLPGGAGGDAAAVTPVRSLLLLAGALPAFAMAQVGGSVGIASEYWARGVPLGDSPAPQLSVNWDGAGGWFAGALLTRAKMRNTGADAAGVFYAGHARRLGDGLSAEGGVTAARFHGAGKYGFQEVFAGMALGRAGVRLHYSPHYYGVYGRSLYAEVNGSIALGENVELALHAGRLQAREGSAEYYYYAPPAQSRTDVRVGVVGTWSAWTAHLSLLAARGDRAPYAVQSRRAALVAGITRSF